MVPNHFLSSGLQLDCFFVVLFQGASGANPEEDVYPPGEICDYRFWGSGPARFDMEWVTVVRRREGRGVPFSSLQVYSIPSRDPYLAICYRHIGLLRLDLPRLTDRARTKQGSVPSRRAWFLSRKQPK